MEYVASHYWELMALCAVVFAVGAGLTLLGNALQRAGERMQRRALDESLPETPGDPDAPEGWYIYPPVG